MNKCNLLIYELNLYILEKNLIVVGVKIENNIGSTTEFIGTIAIIIQTRM